MPIDPDQELKKLDKRLIKLAIIDAPATISMGLALFAKFGPSPETLHPLLGNSELTTAMLIVGGLVGIWSAIQISKISRRKREIQRELNS